MTYKNIPIPEITITPAQHARLQERMTPYADDGKHCPECATPLTIDKQLDEAYCENCNFTIYDYSEL